MQLDAATLQAHEAYTNHSARCPSCYPPTKRYCLEGVRHYANYHAHFQLTLDLQSRRAFLARLEADNPDHCEAIKARMIELHREAKQNDE